MCLYSKYPSIIVFANAGYAQCLPGIATSTAIRPCLLKFSTYGEGFPIPQKANDAPGFRHRQIRPNYS